MDLPHCGQDQPGETYYYSPIFLYCLGIVDVQTCILHAYLYPESAGKKGANNTASLIMHLLKSKYVSHHQLHYNCPLNELNLIMDNCGGQNKKNTIIKMCAYIVEAGWFNKVNIIFLVKGHTKNHCDRNFNLLKLEWHKRNVYTYAESLEVLGSMENVEVIDASNLHFDYSTMLDGF